MNFIQRMWLGLTDTPKEQALMQMVLVFVVEGLLAAISAVLENIGLLTVRQMLTIFVFVLVSTIANGLVKYLHANATTVVSSLATGAIAAQLPVIEKQIAEEIHIADAKGVLFPIDLSKS